MKTILLATVLSLCVFFAYAQQPTTCKTEAGQKKLAGAALNSFMKACEGRATKACDADSKARKLVGAAKTSHMKKCVADAVGD